MVLPVLIEATENHIDDSVHAFHVGGERLRLLNRGSKPRTVSRNLMFKSLLASDGISIEILDNYNQ